MQAGRAQRFAFNASLKPPARESQSDAIKVGGPLLASTSLSTLSRHFMRRHLPSFLPASVLCLAAWLTACGGGGVPSSEDLAKLEARVAPFVGHWVACWATGPTTTEKDDVYVTTAGDGKLKLTRTYNQYTGSLNCTGTPWPLEEEKSDLTVLGTSVTVSDPVLGTVTLESFSRSGQLIQYVQDPKNPSQTIPTPRAAASRAFAGLVPGSGASSTMRMADDGTLDAQGHPTALTPLLYVKQP